MTRVVVAGVVSLRVARSVPSFPVPFVTSQRQPDGIHIRLASQGWTMVRVLQCLGTDVGFATYVGADLVGQTVTDGLRRCGLYGPATLVCAEQPRTMVLSDGSGRRASARDLRGVQDLRYPADVFASILNAKPTSAAILTNVDFVRPLIPVALEQRVPIVTDLQLVDDVDHSRSQDWLRAASIVSCSHENLPISPEAWVRSLWRRYGTDVVLVGCGPSGAVVGVRELGRVWRVDAITPRGVRYTSGAGDTLLATFLHHYLAQRDPVAALRWAVLAAGWKIGGGASEEPGLSAAFLAEIRAHHGLPEVRQLD